MSLMMAVAIGVAALGADWTAAMPGPDLAGWTATGGEWSVEGDVALGKAPAGQDVWLIRGGDLADFELEVEVKIKPGSTGALVFRGHLLPVMPVPEGASPNEVAQTLYGYGVMLGNTTGIPAGSLVDVWKRGLVAEPREAASTTFTDNDWNTIHVVAKGGELSVELNTMKAVTGEDNDYSTGTVAFMIHSGEAAFRNLRIKNLGRVGEWRSLFNGENLDDWTVWGTEEWSVEDGAIMGRSGPKKSEGYLATVDTWKDFHVRGQYRMHGEGNFGLFFHSTIKYNEEQYPMIAGVQGEVAPGWPNNSGLMYESYLRGWLVEPDQKQVFAYAQRPGDWNEIEIKAEGNRRLSWVNGVKVMDWTDPGPNHVEGAFALQLHAGGVDGIEWKEIYVKE